jgi:hypothetical protein
VSTESYRLVDRYPFYLAGLWSIENNQQRFPAIPVHWMDQLCPQCNVQDLAINKDSVPIQKNGNMHWFPLPQRRGSCGQDWLKAVSVEKR